MVDRRQKRSAEREEALQYLVEAVADRSDVRSVALIDGDNRIVAGMGMPDDLAALARVAGAVARGDACEDLESATAGTDLLTRGVSVAGRTLYLAALGTRVRRMSDAAGAVARIFASSGSTA
jgi:hypothetical protein